MKHKSTAIALSQADRNTYAGSCLLAAALLMLLGIAAMASLADNLPNALSTGPALLNGAPADFYGEPAVDRKNQRIAAKNSARAASRAVCPAASQC